MTETTNRAQARIAARISMWVRYQSELSNRVHAAGDEQAQRQGWEVMESTGRFGFGARTYRDPRFDDRRRRHSRWGLSEASRVYAQVAPETPGGSGRRSQ